jgi:hypothetical protein
MAAKKKEDISEALDRIFSESMADTVVLSLNKTTGKVNCAVFSEAFGAQPLRFSASGTASDVMRNMLTSVVKPGKPHEVESEPAVKPKKVRAVRDDDCI